MHSVYQALLRFRARRDEARWGITSLSSQTLSISARVYRILKAIGAAEGKGSGLRD